MGAAPLRTSAAPRPSAWRTPKPWIATEAGGAAPPPAPPRRPAAEWTSAGWTAAEWTAAGWPNPRRSPLSQPSTETAKRSRIPIRRRPIGGLLVSKAGPHSGRAAHSWTKIRIPGARRPRIAPPPQTSGARRRIAIRRLAATKTRSAKGAGLSTAAAAAPIEHAVDDDAAAWRERSQAARIRQQPIGHRAGRVGVGFHRQRANRRAKGIDRIGGHAQRLPKNPTGDSHVAAIRRQHRLNVRPG